MAPQTCVFARPMTSRLSFETADTLIYDPVAGNRATTRSALFSLGFRRIEAVGDLATLADCIQRRPPDLAICEVQGADGELCKLIQNLRQGTDGFNPFVVIIVTAWEKSGTTIRRVIDSGADDLLLRPFSAAVLGDRIRTHVERRKAFVITSEYVGPDRRSGSSRPSDVELFEPPNSLRMKAKDKLTEEQVTQRLQVELQSARGVLTAEKLKRDAFQMCVLWRLMQSEIPGTARYEFDYSKLQAVVRGIAARSAGTEYESAIEWCDAALAAIEGLELGVERNPAMHMLGHAALNLNQVFAPGKSFSEHLGEIDATVALIRARSQAAPAA
jgi:DNA-binding response OmpR family regulator